MATNIYGASDDLIEVDGDISEEFARFAAAVPVVEALGYEPVNPCDIQPAAHDGDCPPGYGPGEGASTRRARASCAPTCVRCWTATRSICSPAGANHAAPPPNTRSQSPAASPS